MSRDFNLLTLRKRRFIQAAIIIAGALILVFIELGFIVPIDSYWSQHITIGLVISAAIFIGATLLLFVDKRTHLEKMLRESEEKYRTLTENSLTGIFILKDGLIAYANKELARITGIPKGDIIGGSPEMIVHDTDVSVFLDREFRRLEGAEEPSNYEIRLKSKKGIIWCEIVANLVHYEQKLSVLANLIDITEQKKRRARLDAIHRVSESLLSSMPVAEIYRICINTIMDIMEAKTCLLYNLENRVLKIADQRGLDHIDLSIPKNGLIQSSIAARRCKMISRLTDDDRLFEEKLPYESAVIVPIVFENDTLGVILTLSDQKDFFKEEDVSVIESISDQMGSAITREMLLKKLEHQARHDPLTGLYNRRFFNEQVQQMITATRTYGNQVTFLMIDIDRFKEINDTHGHLKGDEVLKAVADALQLAVEEDDLVVRFGGDEFLVVLSEGKNPSITIDRLHDHIKQMNEKLEDIGFFVDLSIGRALWDRAMIRNIEDIIHEADENMYKDKKGKQ